MYATACCLRRFRRLLLGLALVVAAARAGVAQGRDAAPVADVADVAPGGATGTSRRVTPTLSLRFRAEHWDWFGDADAERYAYAHALVRAGLRGESRARGWQLELAAPLLTSLPSGATQGHGAAYRRASGGADALARLFVRQAFVALGEPARGPHARLGRFEFSEGGERVPGDAVLAELKRRSVVQRLVGPFGFTQGGRAIDGVDLQWRGGGLTASAMAGVPTRGVFVIDGTDHVRELPVGYAALSGPWGARQAHERPTTGDTPTARAASVPGEWRLFAVTMQDRRGLVPADARPLAARQADRGRITVTTLGAHLLRRWPTRAGSVDLALWGAVQDGRWGAQDHRAVAHDVQLGWQPRALPWHPWLRLGHYTGGGDRRSDDGTHGTFFQSLATPRLYARFPFYNLMNVRDASVSVQLRPTPRLTLRGDLRALRLDAAADGWYQGSGPYDRTTFGLAVRPSGGATALATLIDLSADLRLDAHWLVSAYLSDARPGAVIGNGSPGRFAFVELEWRR